MDVSLRDFADADLPSFRGWTSNDELKQHMSRFAPHSFSSAGLVDVLTNWHVILVDGRDVGCVWIERDVANESVADIGIFLAADADRGHGVGRRALKLAIAAASERWRLRMIRLRVRVRNVRAIACYVTCGFELSSRGEKIVAGEKISIYEMIYRLEEMDNQQPTPTSTSRP